MSEELDYEIEAQNHRAVERAWRGHPLAYVPPVDTSLSSRRVLVTELIEGKRFEEVKQLPEPERDRFAEIVFRFFFGTLAHLRRAAGDPHPGNYLLLADGRVGFLDFGLMRVIDADYLKQEQALARAVIGHDAEGVHRLLAQLGYLPDPNAFDSAKLLGQIEAAGAWYLEPGFRRLTPAYITEIMEAGGSPRSEFFEQMRRQTIPPQALLIRRMEGLVAFALGELRAGNDWHALGTEYWEDAPPSTELGKLEATFWGYG